jgi:hypothetical protein
LAATIIEQFYPRRRSPGFKSVHVVTDLEQVATRRAAIYDFEKAELARTAVYALKPCVIIHRSETFALRVKSSNRDPSIRHRDYPILFNRVNTVGKRVGQPLYSAHEPANLNATLKTPTHGAAGVLVLTRIVAHELGFTGREADLRTETPFWEALLIRRARF